MLPSVWEYCRKSNKDGGLWDDCYPLKLLELWHWLEALKPHKAVELGAGCTTSVFAEYCRRSGAEFVSYEENLEHADKVKARIGREIDIRVVPSVFEGEECHYDNPLFWAHGNVFLYVDGPSNRMPDGTLAVCTDACRIFMGPATVLFDVRVSSARHFAKYQGNDYHIDWGIHADNDGPWYLNAVRHHTVARRNG